MPGLRFSDIRFSKVKPSSFRRRPAASLILEFHRREWNRGSPNRRCARTWCGFPSSFRLAASPPSRWDKSKVPMGL